MQSRMGFINKIKKEKVSSDLLKYSVFIIGLNLSLNISIKSSKGSCIFKSLETTIQSARGSVLPCSNRFERLNFIHYPYSLICSRLTELEGREQTFECVNTIDLLLLRGGIEVDWNDAEKAS